MPHRVDVVPEFLLACSALAALPGPATALFLQRSVRAGRRAGLAIRRNAVTCCPPDTGPPTRADQETTSQQARQPHPSPQEIVQ